MWLRLRQLALVAHELAPVLEDFDAVFGLQVAFRDPGVSTFGLENAVMPVGNQFIEVVAPVQENTAAGRYLNRRKGDGGYMVITHTDDHDRRKAHVNQLGVRTALEFDEKHYHCLQLHPADTGGSFLEIDWQDGGEDLDGPWSPAGNDWQKARNTSVVSGIKAAQVQADDPSKVARKWSEIVELDLTTADGVPELQLDNAAIKFPQASDGRGDGLSGIELIATDRDKALAVAEERGLLGDDDVITICGTRFVV